MRHFLLARSIACLARGVVQAAPTAVLIASAGGAQRRPPCLLRTRRCAIPIAAIAVPAEEEDAAAVDARANDKPKRVQAPPRSGGRAGHARGDMR